LRFMRAAADGEDGSVKHVAMENRLYPLRELFAELLLETGQPAAALSEFEAALTAQSDAFGSALGQFFELGLFPGAGALGEGKYRKREGRKNKC